MMSDDQMLLRRREMNALNELINNKNIGSACKFTLNPCAWTFGMCTLILTLSADAKEEYGDAYYRNYLLWAPGALQQLTQLWSVHPEQHQFKCGTFGSVYFDVNLTSNGVEKRTRVTFMKQEDDGRYWIMLDATFDDEFNAPTT